MKLDSTITRAGSATGGTESHEAFAVGGSGRASGSQRQVVQPFHAADGRDPVLSLFVEIGQFTEDRRFAGRIAELDEMFGGIVETTFRLYRAAAVEETRLRGAHRSEEVARGVKVWWPARSSAHRSRAVDPSAG